MAIGLLRGCVLVGALALAACGGGDEAVDNGAPGADPSAADAIATESLPPELPRFLPQPGWTSEAPSNGMRLMQFSLPGDAEGKADDALLVVSSWPGGIGPLEGNISRWVQQVSGSSPDGNLTAEQRWTEDIRDFAVTTVHLEGGIKPVDGMDPSTPTLDKGAMLASFIEKPGEAPVWTVKAIGPQSTINKHKAAFRAFIAGL